MQGMGSLGTPLISKARCGLCPWLAGAEAALWIPVAKFPYRLVSVAVAALRVVLRLIVERLGR